MILYYDIYIDDTPVSPSNVQANKEIRSAHSSYVMPRKLEIAKYTLASYTTINWSHVIIKFDAKNEDDAVSFLSYARKIFPGAEISRPCSSTHAQYKATTEKICGLEDNWIFYAPNNDHPLITNNPTHLFLALEKAEQLSKKYKFVSIVYSHLSEFINLPKTSSPFHTAFGQDVKIVEETDLATVIVRKNGDNSSCQIVNKNLLQYWFCSDIMSNPKIIRAEDIRKFYLTHDQLMIIPKKELCAHFDGYSHTIGTRIEITPDRVPPLFIPPGFFENKIKIRYGYTDYKDGWVNINPAARKYSFRDNIHGSDLMWTLDDIPLFWKSHISEIDANPACDDIYLQKMADKKYQFVIEPYQKYSLTNLKYFIRDTLIEPFAKLERLLQRTSEKLSRRIILIIAHSAKINLISVAYKDNGILNFKGHQATGEAFLINEYLPKIITAEEPVLFDVGANIGEYASLLRKAFPRASVYAFEPNKAAFQTLERVSKKDSFYSFQTGLSSRAEKTEIFFDSNHPDTQLASLYSDVLRDIHGAEISKTPVTLITLDEFCKEHGINHINFLKIDTEGHELEVLRGAHHFLMDGKIDIIQFEFNEMNVVSRVFLKDFYTLLPNYHLYRLGSHRLIDMEQYKTSNEIFQFQNIIAIKK